MIEVSVIVPNYNHAQFLKERIDSIINQTFQNFEIIILDDCSTDNSREIISQYQHHPQVSQIVFNEQNSGSTFKQWEKGIALAQGEWIWIAESDDWCEAVFLETLLNGLDKNPNTVISYCQSYCVLGDNKIKFQSFYAALSGFNNGAAFISEFMITNNAIFNASMAIWRKGIFSKISKEFTTYKFCGDWLFWIELARHGNVHISGKLLNYFRKHGNDVSGKAYKSGYNFIEESKMFHYLYKNQVISFAEYVASLKTLLLPFKDFRAQLDSGRIKEIESLLYQNSNAKKELDKFYRKYKANRLLDKIKNRCHF